MLCKQKNKKTTTKRGRAGIEPATSPTRRENHTSRPTALGQASNEDRTRDLLLTRQMLCQLSYRGDLKTPCSVLQRPRSQHNVPKSPKECILDGIRTRNPQIRSLVRYPLRHEYLLTNRKRKCALYSAFLGKITKRHLRDSNSRGKVPN